MRLPKQNCYFSRLLFRGSPYKAEPPKGITRVLQPQHFPKVVRSTLLFFSLLDGPPGKNHKFYEFVGICTLKCKFKESFIGLPRQLTIVILVVFLSFTGLQSFLRVHIKHVTSNTKPSILKVAVQGLSL